MNAGAEYIDRGRERTITGWMSVYNKVHMSSFWMRDDKRGSAVRQSVIADQSSYQYS